MLLKSKTQYIPGQQEDSINVETVYTATTHQHTERIYSHPTSTYRLYI